MVNCINKREISEIEIELEMLKTENRVQFESVMAELNNLRQLMLPKDRRRSYNPYTPRNHENLKYI